MLASHKKSNHHVGNFLVGDRYTVFVIAVHEVPDHIMLYVGLHMLLAAFFDDAQVDSSHFDMGSISTAVSW